VKVSSPFVMSVALMAFMSLKSLNLYLNFYLNFLSFSLFYGDNFPKS
jgi:hypothetical protein